MVCRRPWKNWLKPPAPASISDAASTSQGPVAVQDTAMATHLYRIAQEALTNAVKHSQAKRVSIHLKRRGQATRTESRG